MFWQSVTYCMEVFRNPVMKYSHVTRESGEEEIHYGTTSSLNLTKFMTTPPFTNEGHGFF
jgi:hypothetical protein